MNRGTSPISARSDGVVRKLLAELTHLASGDRAIFARQKLPGPADPVAQEDLVADNLGRQ